jgi:hypothetical protein
MKIENKNKVILLWTGFFQVFFVAMNTYFISTRNLYGMIVAGFLISIIWSFNVKKIAFGSVNDRIVYAFGASLGSATGLGVSILWF